MRKKIFYFLSAIILAISSISADAQSATVATVPEGMITFSLPQGVPSYFSLPLTNNEIFSGSVTAVSGDTINVGDTPAPFTMSLSTTTAPYFVKFLSGNEAGRVLLITANTSSSLILDTTDHAMGLRVVLTTTGYNVQVGDTFEIFPGDTLASVFGAGTTASPLVLTGGTTERASDTVSFYTMTGVSAVVYYFNTSAGYWEQAGTTTNANDTIIYPYSSFAVNRRSSNPSTTFVVSGKVTPVATAIKVVGDQTVYSSTQFATNVSLSQLNFSNWVMGTSVDTADTLNVWNPSENHMDTYYQESSSIWHKYPDAVTNQSSFVISAGAVTTITKRETVTNATSFVQAPLPYSLD
jgi:uncharacterized protein (TIGR02597 family)